MRPGSRRRLRPGFTLVEVAIVGLLTALLASLLASACSAFYRSAAEVAARGQLAQEADFAMARLSRDLAGAEANRLVGLRNCIGNENLTDAFQLCIETETSNHNGFPDWGEADVDTIVQYHLATGPSGAKELRRDGILVARHVQSLKVYDLGEWVQFDLTFRHPVKLERVPSETPVEGSESTWLERTYTLLAQVP